MFIRWRSTKYKAATYKKVFYFKRWIMGINAQSNFFGLRAAA